MNRLFHSWGVNCGCRNFISCSTTDGKAFKCNGTGAQTFESCKKNFVRLRLSCGIELRWELFRNEWYLLNTNVGDGGHTIAAQSCDGALFLNWLPWACKSCRFCSSLLSVLVAFWWQKTSELWMLMMFCSNDRGRSLICGLVCSLVAAWLILLSSDGIRNEVDSVRCLLLVWGANSVDTNSGCVIAACSRMRCRISSSCEAICFLSTFSMFCSSAIGPLSCGHKIGYLASSFCHCRRRARCALFSSHALATVGSTHTYTIHANGLAGVSPCRRAKFQLFFSLLLIYKNDDNSSC